MYEIDNKRCRVYDNHMHIGEYKEGTIVGAYISEYWYPKLYRAYHIVFDDDTKDTVKRWKVEVINN